jgi:hypothetical protein
MKVAMWQLCSGAGLLAMGWIVPAPVMGGEGPDAAAPAKIEAARPECLAAEHHQFDFWVGRWEVFAEDKPERKVADSLIEAVYDGCAVRENWMPLKGGGGGSLSAYDREIGRWRQAWIDSTGSWAEFQGGWSGTAMILEGTWPQPGAPRQITRMTYTRQAGGNVIQRGETSDDNGRSYQSSWAFIYRPVGRQ